jgi:beta-RFAP synthase
MIRVVTPSRLHFGLLAPAATTGRRYGSVGLMIERPGIELTCEDADAWQVEGPLSGRAGEALQRLFQADHALRDRPRRIVIHAAAPAHMGLGTGTQLSLALAKAALHREDAPAQSAMQLAQLVGRGVRSAIGIHGFDLGGFLVDGGKKSDDEIAPLVARLPFSEEWRIVLALPPWPAGLSGRDELRAFRETIQDDPKRTEALSRLALLDLLPALAERALDAFGEALFQFNRLAGEWFRGAQGDVYAHPRVAELIDFLRSLERRGVAQSSWGPGTCAVCADEDQAAWTAARVRERFGFEPERVLIVRGVNEGSRLGEE